MDTTFAALEERLRGAPATSAFVWQWFLLLVYSEFPPRGLTAAAVRERIAAVRKLSPGSKGVLTALRKVQISHHPDKNRPSDFGSEWAVRAEEIAKMASHLSMALKQKPAYR